MAFWTVLNLDAVERKDPMTPAKSVRERKECLSSIVEDRSPTMAEDVETSGSDPPLTVFTAVSIMTPLPNTPTSLISKSRMS